MSQPTPPRIEARLAAGSSLRAERGELVRVDDPALLALVAGAAPRGAGVVRLDGTTVRAGVAARVRRGIVPVVDAPVAPEVAVVDHLAAAVPVAAARDGLAACPLLDGRGADPAGVLSGGERRALAWVRAVVLEPRVVVLRDATVGLDADTLAWAEGLVAGWLGSGVAVLEAV